MNDEPNFTLSAALHEFGHEVGLRHEANRLDSPCARDQTSGMSEGFLGSLPQDAYDRDSVMNYGKVSFGASIGILLPLSQGDIATIKALYSGLPKFPREEACRKDGNSWVADTIESCCRLAPGKSGPQKAEYPICPSNNPSPQATTPPEKRPEPVEQVMRTRLSSEGTYRTVLKTPFQFTKWVLICNEGEYLPEKINALVGGLSEVVFKLNQAAGLQRDTFTCTHIDAYDLPAIDKRVDATRKKARLTFPSLLKIKINQVPSKVDNSSLPWQFFDNVQAAPTISPVGGQTSQNPASIATKRLQLFLPKFPKKVVISAASLNCGSEKIAGQAVKTDSQSDIAYVFFTLPANLSCQGTELTVRVPKPNKDQNPKQTTASMESKFLALKFNRTIDLKSQKDEFGVIIHPTQCLSIFSTPAPTPSTSDSSPPKPAAPQPAAAAR